MENVARKRSKLLEQTEIGKPRLDVKVTAFRYREPISQPGYEPAGQPAETPEAALLLLLDWATGQLEGGAATGLAAERRR